MSKALDAIDKLISALPHEGPPEGDEFTIKDWIKRKGYEDNHNGKQNAYRDLERLIASGLITMRKGRVEHKQGNIYKPT